jgi:hypothetical protein
MKRFWTSVDFMISIIPLTAGTVLLCVGLFFHSLENKNWYIPLVLAIVSTALTVCVLRYEIDKHISKNILNDILNKVQSPIETRIIKLDKVEIYYEYLLFRVRTCRESWLDMGGFDPRAKDIPPFVSRNSYYQEREKLAARIDEFRYLAVLRDVEHISRVEKMIDKSRRALSSVRYLDGKAENLNKIEVTLVDRNEVILGYFQPDSELQKYVSIAGAPVVALFQAYYNDLWRLADQGVLKNGGEIRAERLTELRASLAQMAGLARTN